MARASHHNDDQRGDDAADDAEHDLAWVRVCERGEAMPL